MTLHRTSRPNRRRLAAGAVATGIALAGLAVTTSSPALAALPPQCVTVGANVTCTFMGDESTQGSASIAIPAGVTVIQIHAVGQRGRSVTVPGSSTVLARGGSPAVVEAAIAVTEGEVYNVKFFDDGGPAGAHPEDDAYAGAGGDSVAVTRGSNMVAQAAGGGGAGSAGSATSPLSDGGNAGAAGSSAAFSDHGSGETAALGGQPGTAEAGGAGGAGAFLNSCGSAGTTYASGAPGTSSAGQLQPATGGPGADGQFGGGGGGGGRYGGGGGGAGAIGPGGGGCAAYSYGGGGGGGSSTVPAGGTLGISASESQLVRISFTLYTSSTHSPSFMSFGSLAVGSTSAAQTLTVTNTGSGSLVLGDGAVSGRNPGSFLTASDTCSNRTVASGSTCEVGLRFKPLTNGNLSATFTVTDNSSSSPHIVTLTGTGTGPLAITSVSTLAFGAQEIGKAGPAKTVSLTNTGNAPLVVSSTTFGGTNASDFSTTSNTCAGATLSQHGGSCSVSVRMTASAEGPRSGTLTFTHNGPSGPAVVSLTGIGTPPADLAIRGIGSVFTGRDHLVTRTVAGPGKLMIYPLVILNETSVARTYKIRLTKSGSASAAEVWTVGFGAKTLARDGAGDFHTGVVQPNKTVTYNLRVIPSAPGQTISKVDVALLTHYDGLIESLRTETNTAAPAKGTSSFELFSRQGSQLFVGGPLSGQTSTSPALNVGGVASFTLRLKNDGTSPRRIGLRLSDFDQCAGSFAVTATAAGKSVTSAAFAGNHLTPLLAPSRFQDVFVTIRRVAAGCPSKTIRAMSLSTAEGPVVRTSYLLANAAYNAATD